VARMTERCVALKEEEIDSLMPHASVHSDMRPIKAEPELHLSTPTRRPILRGERKAVRFRGGISWPSGKPTRFWRPAPCLRHLLRRRRDGGLLQRRRRGLLLPTGCNLTKPFMMRQPT
jgi:hypothetical protein